MSVLQFIASLASALAWPAAVVVIALVFRVKIAALLSDGVKRFKAGPFEVEWERTVAVTRVELDQPGVPPVDELGAALPMSEALAELVRVSPQDAVVRGYANVEVALREKLSGFEEDGAMSKVGAAGLARLAAKDGLVTPETVSAIEGLGVLRNLAAHGRGGDTTPERAMDYLSLVDAVLYTLR